MQSSARGARRRLGLAVVVATVGCLVAAQTAAAVAPDTTITAGPADVSLTNDNTPTFAFTSDQAGVTFACSIDAMPAVGCTSPYTPGPLADGGHRFAVAATNAGAEPDLTAATRNFTVDTTPPDTSITAGPANGSVTDSDAPMFAWASTEVGSTFTCTTDGQPLPSCEMAFDHGATDGPHTFTVAATDLAGNTDPTPATSTFTVKLQGATPDLERCTVDGGVIFGTLGDDTRDGTPGTDIMFGLSSNDLLRSDGGADCIAGGSGNDTLLAGDGNDFVSGGSGNDRLSGGAGNDELRGGSGDDRISGGAGNDLLVGDAGNDHLTDTRGRDHFSAGPGNDVVDARDTSAAGRHIPDTVSCGAGRFDVAIVDRADHVARDCERVRRR